MTSAVSVSNLSVTYDEFKALNDVSVEIVSGGMEPADAAQQIEDAFSLERQ